MSARPKNKPHMPKNQNRGSSSMSNSIFSQDFDDMCSNEECPARVSFKSGNEEYSPSDKPGTPCNGIKKKINSATQKDTPKNKAGQIPSKSNKAEQNEDDPPCNYPCDVTCATGCFDDLYCNIPWHDDWQAGLDNSDDSDISCHCFDDEEEMTDSDDDGCAKEPKESKSKTSNKSRISKTLKDEEDDNKSKQGKECGSGKGSSKQNDSDDDEDDQAKKGKGAGKDKKKAKNTTDKKPGEKPKCQMTQQFLDNRIIFPCPGGWRVPVNPTCKPCLGCPGNILFPPGCGMVQASMPPMPKMGMCARCTCIKMMNDLVNIADKNKDKEKDGDEADDEDESDDSDDDDEDDSAEDQNGKGKGKGKGSGKDSKCCCSSIKGAAGGSSNDRKSRKDSGFENRDRSGSKSKSPNKRDESKNRDGSKSRSGSPFPKGTKVIPCNKKCNKCSESPPSKSGRNASTSR